MTNLVRMTALAVKVIAIAGLVTSTVLSQSAYARAHQGQIRDSPKAKTLMTI